jgi:hypothetical protein
MQVREPASDWPAEKKVSRDFFPYLLSVIFATCPVVQRVRRTGLLALRINRRKAELTDRSSGKCSATSGESNTRLVPAA